MPKPAAERGRDAGSLIAALERAGLRGHGGAFFPTATKLRAVAAQRGTPIVVVNGSEGEPLSRKDRFLLGTRTDAVLDGVFAVAAALDADAIVLAIDAQRVRTLDAVNTALDARPELSGPGWVGAGSPPTVEVIGVPAGFVTGQETALLNYLGGRDAKPTVTPPYPFEKGLRGRPTLVSNVETFAQIGQIVAGTYDASRYVTVSGAVAKTAVVRVRPDTTVAGVLMAAGGVTDRVSAVLLGGYGGTWAAAPEALELTLDEPALRARGLTMGAGIVYALGDTECAVAEVARVTRWMAGESAGQCGPCVFGLAAIAGALESLCAPLTAGGTGPAALARIERWCAMVKGRGGCAHPDGVARYVTSALAALAPAFADHAAHGPCERCETTARRGSSPQAGADREADSTRAVAA
jgi:NADH:ubiquinone oxidoreductase subunit F (NADH-binding)